MSIKMTTIIIEDEAKAVVALQQEIESFCPELEICGTASTIDEAYSLITAQKPDIVFLDIQLKDGNGFELLSKFSSYTFKVIFTTAYNQYAIRAIKVSALDYLLKPISGEELVQAVTRAKALSAENSQLQLKNFIQNQQLNPLLKKIALPTPKGIFLYELDKIVRLQSEGNYTAVQLTDDRRLLVSKILKDFEEMLSGVGFVRIHHSHIINLTHLQGYISQDGGYVLLSDKSTVPVSKRKRADLLQILHGLNQKT